MGTSISFQGPGADTGGPGSRLSPAAEASAAGQHQHTCTPQDALE